MAGHLAEIFATQISALGVAIWFEPFGGGAGAGLRLVDEGAVDEFWFTEKHPALAAFWRVALNSGDQLATSVEQLDVNMRAWEAARHTVQAATNGEAVADLELALAAFVVNRCSRSGIVTANAGPIGGKHQTGEHRINSRWNAAALADRIRHIHALAPRIRFTEGDAIEHIEQLDGSIGIEDELFLFVDPPYLREGNGLYANGMTAGDHARLATALRDSPARWLLTYDNEPAVHETLYPTERVLAYDIANTANQQRVAEEYAVLSDNLNYLPGQQLLNNSATRWVHPKDMSLQAS